jgi:tetratricopeptide (TPR) repeat protein
MAVKYPKDIQFGDRIAGKQIYFPLAMVKLYQVRADSQGRLRIHDGNREGWVDKADFVLARDAAAYFHRRVQANPKDAWALAKRGTDWLDKGEPDKAIKDFDEYIRLNPTHAVAFLWRGRAWHDKKEYDKAIRDYDECVRLNPTEPVTFHWRGMAWHDQKEYDKAIQDYDEVIRLDPNNAIAFHNRGNAWHDMKEHEKAIRDYDEAIRLDPNNAIPFHSRGNAWHDMKEYDKAIRDYNEAIRLDPKDAYSYGDRARTWAKLKQYDRAVKDFDEAMQFDPMDWLQRDYALFRASCPEAAHRDGKKALELAKKAIQLAGRDVNWSYWAALAAAHAEAGNFDQAVTQQLNVLADPSLARADREPMEKRLERYRAKKPYRAEE